MKHKTLALIAAASLAWLGTSEATIVTFTGGDLGEGLDLTGTFPYAVNVNGSGLTIQGIAFTSDTATTGLAQYNTQPFVNPFTPSYGASANDDALESLVSAGRYANNSIDGTFPFTYEMSNLTANASYKLQIIYFDNGRAFEVGFNDGPTNTVVSLALDANNGTLLVTNVNASVNGIISFTHRYNSGLPNGNLPLLYGFTLESMDVAAVPEPSTLLLIGVGAAALIRWGRQRR